MGALIDFRNEYRENELACSNFPIVITQTYTICACLKQSEMKQVYLIQAIINSKKYILKRVSLKSHEDLEKEYTMHQNLHHPGLVPAVALIKDDHYSYFIREYVEGNTITELVEMTDDGHLKENEIIDITLQLCRILEYLHGQQPPIIHRDIKPDNIILTKEGNCKLIDFGISRRLREDRDKDTFFMGTEYTAPPEQYGFKQTDARSDIYSIGILMYYMATGSLDIREIQDFSMNKQIRKCIQKCTQFSPENRYETVKQLEDRLMKCSIVERRTKFVLPVIGGVALLIILSGSSLYYNAHSKAMQQGRLKQINNANTLSNAAFNSTSNVQNDQATKIYSDTVPMEENNSPSDTELNTSNNISVQSNSDTTKPIIDKNTPYHFSSGLIEAAVRHELGKSDTDSITYADLENISELFICGKQIYDNWDEHFVYGVNQYMMDQKYTDSLLYDQQGDITSLQDISYMKNLHSLALYKQNISDISELQKLSHLNYLGLGANNISNLAPIGNLDKLITLDVSSNPIFNDDLEVITNLPDLDNLDLGDTKISTLDEFSTMKLSKLSLFGDKLYDCVGIDSMKELKELIISGLNVSVTEDGLSNIAKTSDLEQLRLMGGDVFDLSLLSDLKHLNYLDICSIPFQNLKGLEGMNLQTLLFDETSVRDLSALKEIPSLITVGIRNIPCDDYSAFRMLPNLKTVMCNQEQAKKIPEQLEDISFSISCPDFGK